MNRRRLLAGAVWAGVIAGLAWRARALTRGGALAALGVGALTYGAGGWAFTLILLGFFVPSVGLSRIGRARKKQLVDIGKGGARDAGQVLANGAVATACALGAAVFSPNDRTSAWAAAFAGAYAASNADTWGTEIGTLARGTPRSILTYQPIPTGLSGGVTGWGTLAEFAGAAWLAAVSGLALRGHIDAVGSPGARPRSTRMLVAAVALAGSAGAFADSLLGATLQELRRCPRCERNCETDPHVCGSATVLVRGMPGFSNDLVNAAATVVGASAAYVLFVALRR